MDALTIDLQDILQGGGRLQSHYRIPQKPGHDPGMPAPHMVAGYNQPGVELAISG
jgi:hypothetical protein